MSEKEMESNETKTCEILERIRQQNKQSWTCVKFSDKQIYYGETMKVDSDEQQTEEEGKVVREGLGVQFYSVDLEQHDTALQSKYEGMWKRDLREGMGRVEYLDGGVYTGQFKKNVREGQGVMRFSNGWSYEGTWKNNKMEGKGVLIDGQGKAKERTMKKNFVLEDSVQGIFAWPFYSESQLEEYMAMKKQRLFDQDQGKTQSFFYIEKTREMSMVGFKINESEEHDRTPLILCAQDRMDGKQEIFEKIRVQMKMDKVMEVDLKKLDYLNNQTDRNEFIKYRQQIKEDLAEALADGHLMVVNLDDSEGLPETNSYPDLREYYSQTSLPYQIWERQKMERVIRRVFKDTDQEDCLGMHPKFRLIVWSGFRINGNDNKKKIVEVFDKRYSQIVPLEHIDLILILN